MTAPNLDLPRRFYKTADTDAVEGGYAVRLDGRLPKTPAGARLIAPTQALAELLAAEWAAQEAVIRMETMLAVRLAYTAIDRIPIHRAETAAEVARYAGSDVVCYLADTPASLMARQDSEWGAVRTWAETVHGLKFVAVTGLVHRPQPAETLAAVERLAVAADDFTLAGLAFGAALYGSTVLSLAVAAGAVSGEAAFDLSRIDEAFQEERWGVDADAALRTAAHRAEAVMLGAWFEASN